MTDNKHDKGFGGLVGWCYNEQTRYTLDELGEEAWQTGCPLCGDSNCRQGYVDRLVREKRLLNGPFSYLADAGKGEDEKEVK
jgi:hypothetical protein